MKNGMLDKQIGKNDLEKISDKIFIVVIVTSLFFILYVSLFTNLNIFKARNDISYNVIKNPEIKKVNDTNKPLKMYTQYRWIQKEIKNEQNCIAFYTVHQQVEVYYDGVLMYSLKTTNENKVGKTTACNWNIVPIYPKDKGKEICVNIIPVYDSVKNKKINFYIANEFNVYLEQLYKDLPQIILSCIAIAIGIVFAITSLVLKQKGKDNGILFYLGIFSLCIGIWKITDIGFAPLMFPKSALKLSYISILMLDIGIIPWILSVKKQFSVNVRKLLDYSSIICSVIVMIIIILQLTNLFDLRQTLWISHIMMGIVVIMIVCICIYEKHHNIINKKNKRLYFCFILCILGLSMDVLSFYIKETSEGILYTLIAFLNYIITIGFISIFEINHKANIDEPTGLFNKSRCNEILADYEVINEPLGVVMFDLNGLKQINDTLGHEVGDLLISDFANILRYNIYSRDFVGRFGGDEFIAVIKGKDDYTIKCMLNDVRRAVKQYNQKNNMFDISYACGYALSNEYPGLSLKELLKEADDRMYKNKKEIKGIK